MAPVNGRKKMDGYSIFCIKFHALLIAIGSILLEMCYTHMYNRRDKNHHRDLMDLRDAGQTYFYVFRVLWLIADVCLLASLVIEKKVLVCPFFVVSVIEMLLFTVNFFIELKGNPWIFFQLPVIVVFFIYVILSIVALMWLNHLQETSSSESNEPASESNEPALV